MSTVWTDRKIEPLYQQIGTRIRQEREDLGFSQNDLAAEVGLTRTSIVNIEAGRQRMLMHTVYIFADALGVLVACLLPQKAGEL